jgi:hypothetical protein
VTLAAAGAAVALASALAAAPTVTLTAPGHSPKAGTHWLYSIKAEQGGKPAAAKLTAVIVDPIGGVHAVDYGTTTKPLKNWPFTGTFHDFVVWPKSSRGIPVTFRLTVTVGGAKKVITYRVTPR